MSQPIPAVTAYFDDIRQSLGIGVPETSGYPALSDPNHGRVLVSASLFIFAQIV